MTAPKPFSEEFLTLPPEEKLERIKAAGRSDRSNLPAEVQEWMAKADQRVASEFADQLGEPTVIDRRSQKKAV